MSKSAYAALACAAMGVCVHAAVAQEAPLTSGGDVSASDATPLPPIIVESPSAPIRKKAKAPAVPTPSGGAGAVAGESAASDEAEPAAGAGTGTGGGEGAVGIFTLGQLDLIGGSTITNDAMWTFNKQSLDQAAGVLPGVTMQNTGGSRNERDLFVRGFDRLRVPLSIDGVRLYLPADNRLDFNRFLTPDLSEIQVQKGYVSVLNGPGGLGGAINTVSRKPTKALEIEGRTGATFDGSMESVGQWNGYAFAGTRQDKFYAQLSGTIVDQDHWSLPDDFTPNLLVNEDGGDRDHSEFRDWRVNAKIGYTPRAGDEYTINYTSQHGEKSAPLHVDGQRVQGPRYWLWPDWDMDSISWLSKTEVGGASYVKTNAYYNTFYNVLSTFTDITYTTQSTTGGQQGLIPFAFVSTYDDYAYGGFIEFGTKLVPMNTLKGAVHYRRDVHREFDHIAPDGTTPGTNVIEPWSGNEEQTWSFALENTFHATSAFDIVVGASYNRNVVDKASAVNSATNTVFQNPTTEAEAWDGQGAAIYRFSDTGTVHADVSSRTRFPTAFDRYSTRFGARPINPDLKPERATNYEIGWSDTLFGRARIAANVFYSDLDDSIVNVFAGISGSGSIVGINADGEHYGLEVSADWDIMPGLRIGGNYTYLERSLDFRKAAAADPSLNASQRAAVAAADVEGTPRHEAFIYLAWSPTDRLTLTPSLELASDRTSLITSCRTTLLATTPTPGCPGAVALPVPVPNYVTAGSYALLNVQAEYQVNETFTAAVGATNLLDETYQLAHGFPEPGRMFFANVRARF